ncbi:MAG TPA: peptidase S41, partial [Blastocatellia bacterium]|nr:peptidase S41 [Blastocatellia bacterium]
LYVITGNSTASSGMLCAIDFRNQTNAILLGEPTGGKPNSYGNILSLTLPNSGLACSYSIKYFSLAPGDPAAVFPDVTIPMTAMDFINRNDPVLSYILAH